MTEAEELFDHTPSAPGQPVVAALARWFAARAADMTVIIPARTDRAYAAVRPPRPRKRR